jgi:hypothetical protein
MRQIELHIDPENVDANGLAEAQAVASAGALSLNGALIVGGVFTGDYARQISITSDGADGGRTFTLVGTDADGKSQTEDITGPASATVESVEYYKTITSITVDDACAGNISSGTVDEFVTQTIPIETGASDAATISLERFSGTIDVTVQVTKSRIQYTDSIEFYAGPTSLQGQTSASTDDIDNHASGFRVVCNSYSSGAELRCICNTNRS